MEVYRTVNLRLQLQLPNLMAGTSVGDFIKMLCAWLFRLGCGYSVLGYGVKLSMVVVAYLEPHIQPIWWYEVKGLDGSYQVESYNKSGQVQYLLVAIHLTYIVISTKT